MVNIVVVKLDTFEDLVYFVHSRLTTVSLTGSIFCKKDMCFTIIGSDEQYFVIKSPPPKHNTRFVYIDESGTVKYSNAPPVGKPALMIVNVSELTFTSSFEEALKP